MKNLPIEFRQKIFGNLQQYLAYADITLSDDTELNLTNPRLWSGGFSYEEAVSDDNNFNALGSVIIGSATIIINNIDGIYSDYDFINADVELFIGLQLESTLEKFQVGTYRVDDATYNGATITLTLLDNMLQLDRPYSESNLVYPATLLEIVQDICSDCGNLTLVTQNFPHKEFEVDTFDKSSVTYREVLSWVAAIAGCFAKFNATGGLELKWFDRTALETFYDNLLDGGTFDPWSTGQETDGGTFNPWTEGIEYEAGSFTQTSNVHLISALYSQNIAQDDIVITGVSVPVRDTSENATSEIVIKSTGTPGYVIELEENPLFTMDNAQTIINWLGVQLIGLRFRKLTITNINDPSIESGDVAIVIDRKQQAYKALITRVAFSVDNYQTVVSGGSTPPRNSAVRFSSETKSYVESRRMLKQEKSEREAAEEQLRTAIQNAAGLYYTAVQETGGAVKYYLHDHPLLADSNVRILFSTAGITVTPDKGLHEYGLTVSGDMLLNLLSATGISFDWAHGGLLKLGGNNNINGTLRIVDASDTQIGKWDKDGISMNKGTIQGPNITVGGQYNADGIFEIKNASATTIVSGNSIGITAQNQGIIQTNENDHRTVLTDGSLQFYSNYPISGQPWLGERKIGEIGFTEDGQSDTDFSIWANRDMTLECGAGNGLIYLYSQAVCDEGVQVTNGIFADTLSVSGSKHRCVQGTNYGDLLLYSYETASPMFGDIGFGKIESDGTCLVSIDDIFDETVNANVEYAVSLQKEGPGDLWVSEKEHSYFIVTGTPGLKFSWEIKVSQNGFETQRLDDADMLLKSAIKDDGFLEKDFDKELADYDKEMEEIFE